MKRILLLTLLGISSILTLSCDLSSTHSIEVQVNRYKCNDCGYVWMTDPFEQVCPECNSPNIHIVAVY